MENFTPLPALAGGALIGLAASMLLSFNGRIAGISGIVGGLLSPMRGDIAWRLLFLAGLLGGGGLLAILAPQQLSGPSARSLGMVLLAGIVVGVGVRMGNGCTSGHGVCGLARFSPRSLVATLTFMATGFATATLLSSLGAG